MVRIVLLSLALVACTPIPPAASGPPLATLIPTLDTTSPEALCAAVEALWDRAGSDGPVWPSIIGYLEPLAALAIDCPGQAPSADRLYTARYNQGQSLAAAGDISAAVSQFEAARALNPARPEAPAALSALGVMTPEPLARCSDADVAAFQASLPSYEPSGASGFARVEGRFLTLNDQPFAVRGINYSPAHYVGPLFGADLPRQDTTTELELIRQAGFNTIRLALTSDAFFQCPGNGAVPISAAFGRLDAFIQQAAGRGLRLILTLTTSSGRAAGSPYREPELFAAQAAFLVERYRDEATILAWDLRSGGDRDYRPGAGFSREEVLLWLARMAEQVRSQDGNHPVTASWEQDAEATLPYVDFVSFQHYDNAISLRQRIAALRSLTDKPVLLTAIGYSTTQMGELQQGQLLLDAIQAAEYDGLAGWLVWTAFDTSPDATCADPPCPVINSPEQHFGLWRADYQPKAALGLVRIALYEPGEALP